MEECAQFTLAQRLVQIQSEFDGSIHRDESGATEALKHLRRGKHTDLDR